PFREWPNHIPLDIHPLDSVEHDEDRPNRPWHTWFNAHGRRLVKDHMDGFWTALKRELDERNLCYPRTLWWDQEDWARPTQAVRNLPGGVARGTFTLQLADARAATEQLMDSPTHGTLDEIWTATGPGYQDAQDVTSVANRAFLNWYLGWSIAIGQQAMRDAMMAKAKELFPLAVWSNYDCFSADNPDFRYVGGTPRLGYYNTPPADQATMHGDYSSPKLYTPGNLYGMVNTPGRLAPEMGVTFPQVMRNIHKSRIDACTNAFTAKPVTPHFETGLKRWAAEGGSDPQVFYKLTSEDDFDIMGHAWKRG